MCGPAAPILAAVGAAVSAAGTIQSGMAARSQGRYEAAVANQNARLANNQAADAMARGRIEQTKLARQYSQMQGQQTAAAAANGIDTAFGSAGLVGNDTAMLYGEDAATLSRNTVRETEGFDISASNYRSSAVAAKARGKAAFTSSLFSAGGTILGGASQYGKLKAGGFGATDVSGISTSGGTYVYGQGGVVPTMPGRLTGGGWRR